MPLARPSCPSSPQTMYEIESTLFGTSMHIFSFEASNSRCTDALGAHFSHVEKTNLSGFRHTSFLFSILALHDNPSDEPATALLDLIEEIAPFVNVEMLVAPITVDEARTVLRGAKGVDKEQCSSP